MKIELASFPCHSHITTVPLLLASLVFLGLSSAQRPRVIGGINTQPNEFPWMVLIRLDLSNKSTSEIRIRKFCGGAIPFFLWVGQNWIVTAASCSGKDIQDYLVTAADRDTDFPDIVNEQSRRPIQILVHPEYNPATFANDIALWKVFPPFALDGTTVKSIPNAHFNFFANGTGTIAGWGDRNERDPNGPRILQKAYVQILSNSQCQSMYDQATKSKSKFKIGHNQICSTWASGDSCKGDSGGTLTIPRNGIPILAGIISNTGKCARFQSPRIYTRVSSFYDWIQVETTN